MDDKRLIEDYLPIEAISAEASREKSVRKGHISTLHLWWARRPLVACRAAVYGALVPASRFVPENGADEKKKSLGRANSARFVKSLCRYPSDSKPEEKATIERAIQEAQRHILVAHADRLTAELQEGRDGSPSRPPAWVEEFKFTGDKVTVDDITAGRAPRPRVLDMFAGGGAIPLEALRLGCEAYALDLNPVAHIIQLCTLVYPQKYGKPDPAARGMTGPKDKDGNPTWGGLADEVRYWGNWMLKKVKAEIGDLYPLIPDPEYKGERPPIELDRETGEWVISRKTCQAKGMDAKIAKGTNDPFAPPQKVMNFAEDAQLCLSPSSTINHKPSTIPPGYLIPVAYLWTRTVKCKNPTCGATVPLVKQTWLCKKDGRYVAMKMVAPKGKKEVRFEVVESRTEKGIGFDPTAFSKAGNAACPFCGTVADSDHVKAEGCAGKFGYQPLSLVCLSPMNKGRQYVDVDEEVAVRSLALDAAAYSQTAKTTIPDEVLEANPRSFDVQHFGFSLWRHVFLPRQLVAMVTFSGMVCRALPTMAESGADDNHKAAVATCLSMIIARLANQCSSLCRWQPEFVAGMLGDAGMPMIFDFAEINPLTDSSGGWPSALYYVISAIETVNSCGVPATVVRGSALATGFHNASCDAIVTDPPYYDSRSYSNLSDHFYVWHKRILSGIYPQDFVSQLTPKKSEAIAASYRHNGVREVANAAYEGMMEEAFHEAHRLLKAGAPLVCVYAHKTTVGWSTLLNALRHSGFCVTEAWPVEMERKVRPNALETAALASSIFLVARKRNSSSKAGNYETDVVPELSSIVRERVETLWEMGISGADLVIACVGAGLRAFTKYARVEYGNGEEVPAERFLMEVEAAVLETILGKLSKVTGGPGSPSTASLSSLDPATRFYVLWRYTYGAAELDAGEAIIFANGTHVELEGQHSLTQGNRALLEKKKSKYRLHDFTERGDEEKLGRSTGVSPVGDHGQDAHATTIDALHRLLWLLEHKPLKVPDFLNEAKPNVEQLRLVAQALAGPALKGLPAALRSAQAGGELSAVSTTAEQSALGKLLANWNAVMVGKAAIEDRRTGQQRLL